MMCPMDGAIIIMRPSSSSARAGTFSLRAEDAFSGRHQFLQVGQEHRHAANDPSALSAPSKQTASYSHLLEQKGQLLSASWPARAKTSSDPISNIVGSHGKARMARRNFSRGTAPACLPQNSSPGKSNHLWGHSPYS